MTMAHKYVVVGYDGSKESDNAVTWAARAARRRGAELLVVAATGWVKPPPEVAGLIVSGENLAQRVADVGAEVARKEAGEIVVEARGVQNTAVAALTGYSHEAELIVVGHRGAGALRLGQIGSVAFATVNQAKCPVAVIRGEPGELPHASLPSVVAVDGSKHSDVALDRAARWAAESASPLRIVSAWRTPLVHPWSSIAIDEGNKVNREASVRAREEAQRVAERAQERVQAAHPDLEVELIVEEGRAAEVIVAASTGASLVIVGARGRGDLASIVLGSVSREVIEHAHSPVYVVR